MAKYCPMVDRKVLYMECLECDKKVCKNQAYKESKKISLKKVKKDNELS